MQGDEVNWLDCPMLVDNPDYVGRDDQPDANVTRAGLVGVRRECRAAPPWAAGPTAPAPVTGYSRFVETWSEWEDLRQNTEPAGTEPDTKQFPVDIWSNGGAEAPAASSTGRHGP